MSRKGSVEGVDARTLISCLAPTVSRNVQLLGDLFFLWLIEDSAVASGKMDTVRLDWFSPRPARNMLPCV